MPVKLDLFVLCVLKLVRYLVMISVLLNQTSNSIAPSFFFCYRLHDVTKVRKFEQVEISEDYVQYLYYDSQMSILMSNLTTLSRRYHILTF